VATLYLGIVPDRVLRISLRSAQDLVPPVQVPSAAQSQRPAALPAQ
jgi:hypothetical protein